MRNIGWKKTVLILVALFVGAANAQTHFVFTGNTGNNATVGIPLSASPSINGAPLSNGDEIGAFTPGGLCVGAVVWNGASTAITVWGDNDQTSAVDGIRSGEQISYRVWQKSTNTEYDNVSVTYSQGNGIYGPDNVMLLSSLNANPSSALTPSHFVFAGNTGNDATVGIPLSASPTIDGVPLSRGDEIGAFTPGGLCVGAVVWDSSNTAMTVWGDNDQTTAIDGIQPGQRISFRVWKKSADVEYANVTVTYSQGDGIYSADTVFTLASVSTITPSAPGLTNPASGATSVPVDSVFSWDPSMSATSYQIQISTDPAFTQSSLDTSGVIDTSITAYGLQYTTLYYWRVRAFNGGATGSWSIVRSFTTAVLPPPPPVLVSPSGGAVDVPVNESLIWQAAARAYSYTIQVSTDSTFATMAFDTSGVTDTLCTPSGLLNSSKYFWRVEAVNEGGHSGWSVVRNFTTPLAIPTPPVLFSPSDGAAGISTSPLLSWHASAGAASYRIQISPEPTFDTTVVDTSGVTVTSLNGRGLRNYTKYYWRVNATNLLGTGAWSDTLNFRTVVGPPSLTGPANGAIGVSTAPSLSWNTSEGAVSYEVQVAMDPNFTSLVYDSTGIAGTSIDVASLSTHTIYYWRVNASDTSGKSTWSVSWEFTTVVAAPLLAGPLDGTAGIASNPLLSWNTDPGAVGYRVQLSTDSSFGSVAYDSAGVTGTSLTVRGLSNYTKYYWRVSATDGVATSSWSAGWSFTTVISSPVLLSPANGTGGVPTNPTVSWSTVSGATSYELQLATDSSFVSVIYDSGGITGTSKNVTGLGNYTRYYWRVRAANGGGTSLWAARFGFRTIIGPPVISTETSPVSSQSIKLIWNPAAGAKEYHVFRGPDSTSLSLVDSTDSTFYINSGLSPNTSYWFALSSIDDSSRVSGVGLAVKVTTNVGAATVNISPSKPLKMDVSWTAVGGASYYLVFRGSAGTKFGMVDSTSGLTCVDSGLGSATSYSYFVLGVGRSGFPGDTGNVASAMTYPAVPALGSVIPVSDWEVDLSWYPDSGSISGYNIFRSSDSLSYTRIDSTSETTYADTGLVALTKYWYKLSAKNTDGLESDPSPVVEVTTLHPEPRIVYLHRIPGSAGHDIQFSDSVYVLPGDTVGFLFLYSLNGGVSFDTVRSVSSGKPLVTSNSSDTVTWHSKADAPEAQTDSAVFKVVPFYRLGTGGYRATPLFVLDNAPPIFSGLAGISADTNMATLHWSRGKDLSLPLTYYIYESAVSGGENFASPDTSTTDTSIVVRNLRNFTRYYFVVRAVDTVGNVDNNLVERSIVTGLRSGVTGITTPSRKLKGDVKIVYTVKVFPQDTISLNCYFSFDGGKNFIRTTNISGKISHIFSDSSYDLIWHSAMDYNRNESATVRFKIVPVGLGGVGDSAETGNFVVDNKYPTFAGLKDVTSGNNELKLAWSPGQDMSLPLSYLVYSSEVKGGEDFAHPDTVTSNTSVMLKGLQNFRSYYFVVRAEDSLGNVDSNTVERSGTPRGITAVTGISTPSGVKSGDVKIKYAISVPNQDSVHLQCWFSADSGRTYLYAGHISGKTSGITASTSDSLVWHSRLDFFSESRNVMFKIVPAGRVGTGDSVSTGLFALDDEAPRFHGVASCDFRTWSSERIVLNPATDMTGPVRYSYFFSTSDTFDSSRPDSATTSDSLIVRNLPAMSNLNFWVWAADSLGNQDSLRTKYTIMMPAVGSFSRGNAIGTADLAQFVNAWTYGNTMDADLAPYTGTFPHIIVDGDGKLNVEDLVVFAKMWNYSLNANMLSGKNGSPTIDAELPRPEPLRLNVNKSTRVAELSLSPDVGNTIMSCGVRIYYGSVHTEKGENITVDSVFFANGGLTLTFNDTVNKVIYLDYGKVGGFRTGDGPLVFLKMNVPEFSPQDSMSMSLVGYDSEMDRVISNAYSVELRNVPTTFNLYQNYPNPFNPTTTIQFDIPKADRVTVTVYNILGQRVATVVDKMYQPGTYTVRFNAARYASGAYFCVMQAGNYRSVKKMMLIK